MGYLLLSLLTFFLAADQDKPPVTLPNLPVQPVGAGDLLVISSTEAPELGRSLRVRADGTIPLPGTADSLHVEGMLPAQIEAGINWSLQQAKLYIDPSVSVAIAEYQSRPVSVTGAVKKPLVFQALGGVHLLEAIARAEGLSPEAGGEIIVTKKGSAGPLHIPVKELLSGVDPSLNTPLSGGDEVRVPEAGKIVVWGNVKKPGVYPVQESGRSSVMTVLAQAEGVLTFTAKTAYLYRADGKGGRAEIAVELARLIARKTPDVPLEPQDILYIPDNSGRRLTLGALDRIAGFGASTASGLIIWKH